MEENARRAWVVAGFATALYLALVVAAYGFVSLLTNAEVISSADAGRLVGPAIVGASALALLLHLGRALRTPQRVLAPTVLAAAFAWGAAVVVAIIGYAIATGTVLASLIFGLGFGIGWFGLLIPVLAALVAWLALLVAGAQSGGIDRPRWPWERDEE
ncbi:MAG: hypothetical protein K0S05_1112 [Agromyces sp.]|jgi:hypothetical protein|nr:hypothetical protein [Agromyces sp.]